MTNKEKLLEFIQNLTDAEAKKIVANLTKLEQKLEQKKEG